MWNLDISAIRPGKLKSPLYNDSSEFAVYSTSNIKTRRRKFEIRLKFNETMDEENHAAGF